MPARLIGEALEPRLLLSVVPDEVALVRPHFTNLVQPPPTATTLTSIALPSQSPTSFGPIAPASTSTAQSLAAASVGVAPQASITYNRGLLTGQQTYTGGFSYGTAGNSIYEHYFTVATGTLGSKAVLSFNSAYGDLDLYFYDRLGNLLASSTGYGSTESIALAGYAPGEYYLKIQAAAVGPYGVSYSLTIGPPPTIGRDAFDAIARNDSIARPTVLGTLTGTRTFGGLSLDTYYNYQSGGTIYYGNDVDWYEFRTTGQCAAGDEITSDFDAFQAPVDLALFDVYGNLLGLAVPSNNFTPAGFDLEGLPAGIYYLAAFTTGSPGALANGNHYGTNSDYSLSFTLPPPIPVDAASAPNDFNSTFARAYDLGMQSGLMPTYGAPGSSLSSPLTIDTPFVGDWYKFQIGAGATTGDFAAVRFNAWAGQLNLGLTDASGNVLGLSTALGNTQSVSLAYLPAGTYYLYVAGAYGATNPGYYLTINAPYNVALGPDLYDQQASNNDSSVPTVLGALSGLAPFDHLTIAPGDVDWYRFSTSGGSTSAHYVGLNFNPSQGLIDAAVFDAQGNWVGAADQAAYYQSDRGTEARISLQGQPAGTYYVVVYGLNGATSPNYALNFNVPGTTSPSSPNNSAPNAVQLGWLTGIHTYATKGGLPGALPNPAPLSVLSASDSNWFAFTLKQTPVPGNFVSIAFDNSAGGLEVDLLDSSQHLVAHAESTDGAARFSLHGNSGIVQGGTYYVRVVGYKGGSSPAYTLRINAPGGDRFEPNDSRAKAYVLNDPAVGTASGGHVHGLQTWGDLSIETDQAGSVPGGGSPPSHDEDWYQFAMVGAGLSGNFARIDFDRSLGDLDLALYDGSGNLIALASTAQGFEQISLQGLQADTAYYLQVLGYNGATNPDYTLTLNAPEPLAADAYGPNNARSAATALGTVLGPKTIDDADHPLSITSGDEDWFSFATVGTGGAGHFVSIAYNQAAGPLVLELYGSSGTLVQQVNAFGDTESIGLNTLPAGTYYVRVYGYQGATNPHYALAINAPGTSHKDWAEPNGSRAQAYGLGTVSGPKVWQGLSIDTPNDKDWYTFATSATGGAADGVGIAFDVSLGQLDMALIDGSGNRVDARARGGSQWISMAGRPAGTYSLEVYGAPSETGSLHANPSYTLYVTAPGRTAFDAVVQRQNGHADNHSLANAFNLGAPTGAGGVGPMSLLDAGETDWFQFTVPAGRSLGADNFIGVLLDSTLGDLDAQLTDSSGSVLTTDGAARQSLTSKNFERISLAGLAAGTYYVKVFGHDGATNPQYDLVWQLPDPIAPSNGFGAIATSSSAADLHTIDGVQSFPGQSLRSDTDQNWFKFNMVGGTTGVPGQAVVIDYDATMGQLALELYRASNLTAPIATSSAAGGRQMISLAGRSAADGPYYVRVVGQAGPGYTLTISAPQTLKPDWAENHLGHSSGGWALLPDNNSLANAYDLRALTAPALLAGLSIDQAGQKDYFRFTIASAGLPGNYVELDTNSHAGGLLVEIVDANTGAILLSTATVLDSERLSLEGLAAGAYAIVVGAPSSATNPSYSLIIVPPAAPAPDFAELNNDPATAFDLGNASEATTPRIDGLGGSPLSAAGSATVSGWKLPNLYLPNGNINLNGIDSYTRGTVNAYNYGLNTYSYLNNLGAAAAPTALSMSGLGPALSSQIGDLLGVSGTSGSSLSFAQPQPVNPLLAYQQQLQLQQYQRQQQILQQQQQQQAAARQAQLNAQYQQAQYQAQQYRANPFTATNGLSFLGPLAGMSSFMSSFLPYLNMGGGRAIAPGGGLDHLVTFAGLSLNHPGQEDWFKFAIDRDGQAGQFASVAFDRNESRLQIALYASDVLGDANAAPIAVGATDGGLGRIDLNGLAAGTYYLKITGDNPTANYNLLLNATVAPPSATTATDWAQPNSQSAPYDLRAIEGPRTFTGLAVLATNQTPGADWFAFQTTATGGSANFVEIDFDPAAGDLDLALYNSNGPSATPVLVSQGTTGRERVSLAGLAAGTYYLKVYGYGGASNADYALSINAPQPVRPDALGPNGSFALATDLDRLGGVNNLNDLSVIAGAGEYFRFALNQTGRASDQVSIDFDPAAGALQLQLYDANQALLATSAGTMGGQAISLENRAAGTYYLKVSGQSAGVANRYNLHLNAAAPTAMLPSLLNAWTIMVYMTVDNLGAYAQQTLIGLQQAAAKLPGNVKIAALLDQNSLDASQRFATGAQAPWGDTGEAFIQPSTDSRNVATTFASIGEKNTGDPQTLENFIAWATAAAPAQHYALFLWDHGGGLSGVNEDFESPDGPGGNDALTPTEIGEALATMPQGLQIDVLAFDACLMGMAEVATAAAANALYIVGSEASVAGAGIDYTTALSILTSAPESVGAGELASSIVQSYAVSSAGQIQDNTLSATSSWRLFDLNDALKTFVTDALADSNGGDWGQIRAALNGVPAYENPDYRDLGSFMANIAAQATNATLAADARAVLDALSATVVARTNDFRGSRGLAIYLPGPAGASVYSAYAPTYKAQNAFFESSTHWGLFLDTFVQGPAPAIGGDWAGANANPSFAFNLGPVLGNGLTYDGLWTGPDQDHWFRFTTNGTGTAGSSVALISDASAGDLAFFLYDAKQALLAQGTTSSGAVALSLNGLAAGQYYVKIHAGALAHGSAYQLQFNAPPASGPVQGGAHPNDQNVKARDLGLIGATTQFAGNVAQPGSPSWFQFETPRESTVARKLTVNSPYSGTIAVALYAYVPTTGAETLVSTTTGTGTVTVPYSAGAADTYRLKVAADNASAAFVFGLRMEAVPAVPGVATQLAVTAQPPGSVVAGAGFGLTISVENALGHVVSGYNGTVTIGLGTNPGSDTLGGTLTANAVNGVATFTGLSLKKAAAGYTLQATASGLTAGNTSTFNVVAAAASQLAFGGTPASATAGVAFNFSITARDAYGNTATGYIGTVAFTSSDGAAALPASYTFTTSDAGARSFSIALNTAGAQTIVATDNGSPALSTTAHVAVGSSQSSAMFLKADTTTLGNWIGTYGADGQNVIGTTPAYPSYATAAMSGASTYTWPTATAPGALQLPGGANGRIAACWYSASSFTIDVNINGSAAHSLALYFLDYDQKGRNEQVKLSDATTGAVLDTQNVSAFSGGKYLQWKITGHVLITVTNLGGLNALVSGMFFDPPGDAPPASASATFFKADTTTLGNWIGAYGADGQNVIGTTPAYPSYTTAAMSGASTYTWPTATAPGALQLPGGANGRIAACWYSASSFTIDVNINGPAAHNLALYFLDYDQKGRNEQVKLSDANTGAVLDTQTVSAFSGGKYLQWKITGHVLITVTNLGGLNALVSGMFFDPPGDAPPASASATFLKADTTTLGNWIGAYGADGQNVIGATPAYPSYATAAMSGASTYTWPTATAPGALQLPGGANGRIAACWYSAGSFTIDVNINGAAAHNLALYFLDYDQKGRNEQVKLSDANTGAVLDTQTVSAFSGGKYLQWKITGHVLITVTNLGGLNALVSGMFFDPPSGAAPSVRIGPGRAGAPIGPGVPAGNAAIDAGHALVELGGHAPLPRPTSMMPRAVRAQARGATVAPSRAPAEALVDIIAELPGEAGPAADPRAHDLALGLLADQAKTRRALLRGSNSR